MSLVIRLVFNQDVKTDRGDARLPGPLSPGCRVDSPYAAGLTVHSQASFSWPISGQVSDRFAQ